jgi:glycosyltransferase involved in cell wall biosynthesis
VKLKTNVLFLGHDASRTGAPLLLLKLLEWFETNSSIKPSVLLKRGGELESEYRDIAPKRFLIEDSGKINGRLHRRVLRKLRLLAIRRGYLTRLYPAEEFPVVYANTIDSTDLILRLAGPGRRIIHHIHELSYTTEYFDAVDALKKAVPHTFAYIVVSHSVREYLEKTIGVPAGKIRVIHGFPLVSVRDNSKVESRQTIRRRLGIGEAEFVVGMCGLPQWRKGSDLFVQLAMHMQGRVAPAKCHLVWLGGNINSHREALYDVAKAGLQDVCHFIPAVPNPEAYFGAFDLFALSSREDPFSVAMLEAAASGLPIVCFAGAGGAPELVENDAGLIVPYLDVPAMASACAELLLDESRRKQMGETACAKVRECYTLAIQGPKILAVIEAAMDAAI